MGWFSSVCSAVGSVCSGIGSAISSAVSTVYEGVKSVASAVWDGAKRVATAAVGWMSEKAEMFVNAVDEIWDKIKPLIRPALKAFGEWAPWPWLKAVAKGLEKALDWVETYEHSTRAKKLRQAFEWVAKATRNIKEYFLTDKELEEAQEREETFREVSVNMPSQERKAVALASLINKFIVTQSLIQKTLEENTVKEFDHYLRLRATQKLLAFSEKTLIETQDIENISDDDVFLLSVSASLLTENPTISNEDMNRLNGLIYKRYNKELIPFIFEEMVVAWSKNLLDRQRDWELGNKALSKDAIRLRTLENQLKLDINLNLEEQRELSMLQQSVSTLKSKQDELAKNNRNMQNYVYAAEGFLEILEESAFLADKEHLVAQTDLVGKIIIDCAQHGKRWEQLSEVEQELIIDFANIFKNASEERAKSLQVVEVNV